MQCQAKRDYRDFWPPFFERWFTKFPKRAVVFPEIPGDTILSKEQKAVLEAAMESQMDQLRNKLHNNWGVKWKARVAKDTDAKATTALIADLIRSKETRRRKPPKIEAYLNLYYEDKIRPTIDGTLEVGKSDALAAAVSGGSKGEKLPPKLATIMNKTCEMFRSKSPEVVAKVEEHWKEMVAEKKNKDEWNTRDKQYYIDRIAPTVAQFLTGFKELTGWSFSVLMGEPTLEDGGKIEACSLHIGVTELGHMFDQAYSEFNNSMMQPYREFLDHVTTSETAKESLGKVIQISPKESVVEAEVEIEPHPSTSTHVATDVIASGAESGSQTLTIPTLRLTSGVEEFAVSPISPDVSSLVSWSGLEDFSGLPPIQSLDAVSNNFTYNFNPTAMEPLDNFLAKYGSRPLPQPPTASNVTMLPSASSGGNHVIMFQHIVAAASTEAASSIQAQVDQSMIPQARLLAAVAPPSTVQTQTVVSMTTLTSSSPQTLANESASTASAKVTLSVPSTSQQVDQPMIPQTRPLAAITMLSTIQTQTVIPLTTLALSSPQTLTNESAAASTEVALVPSTLQAQAVQSQPTDVVSSVPSTLQAQVDQPTMLHGKFLAVAIILSAIETDSHLHDNSECIFPTEPGNQISRNQHNLA